MKMLEAFAMARSQISWILALIVSTVIIIQLERVDFRDQISRLERNPLHVADSAELVSALENARIHYKMNPEDPQVQTQILTALSVSAIFSGPEEYRSEALLVLGSVDNESYDSEPLLAVAISLAKSLFRP